MLSYQIWNLVTENIIQTELAPTLLVDEIRKNVYNSNLLLLIDLSKPSVFGHFKFLAELLSKTVKKMV